MTISFTVHHPTTPRSPSPGSARGGADHGPTGSDPICGSAAHSDPGRSDDPVSTAPDHSCGVGGRGGQSGTGAATEPSTR